LIKAIKWKVQIGSWGRMKAQKESSPLAFPCQNLHGDPLFGQGWGKTTHCPIFPLKTCFEMANCLKGSNPKLDNNIELGGIQGVIEWKIHITSSSVEGWHVIFRIVPAKTLKGIGMLCSRF
jgi:hypothetical protein